MTVETKTEEGGRTGKIETFDDVLPYIGENGRYQWFLFLLLLPFSFVYAFLYFTQFFLTLVPDEHWCTVPELDGWNLTDLEKIALSIPMATSEELKGEDATAFSKCQMYAVNYTDLLNSGVRQADASWPKMKCQSGWSFNYTTIPYASIAAELEWVCDKTYLSSATQSAFFVGSIIGGFAFGYIADHYGRIPALVSCNAVGFLASAATALSTDFWSFCICRIFAGTAFDNCFSILFIVVMEYVGCKYRTIMANMSFGIYFAASSSILPWIAYYIADWRMLCVATTAPLLITFAVPWLVPESARWYISSGKVDKAIEMLKKFEKVNGKSVKAEIYEEFARSCNNTIKNDQSSNKNTVLDLFKKARLARLTTMLILQWLLIILVFDGHVWNMKLLHPDVFTAFSLAALTELPAAFIIALLLDKWGRRWTAVASMAICGVFSFIALLTPNGAPTVAMAIMARFGVNLAANIAFQYAAELLPTVVRGQGISLIHVIGYLAHIIGPYIVYLADVAPQLPLIVLGALSIVVSVLALSMPETLGQDMPESLQDGNDFGREQNFWWMPCIASSPLKKTSCRNTLGVENAGFDPSSLPGVDSTRL